ncbi:cbb3-type cytochrome c oxidase subunit 3 [Brucellaceae bacterium C25G]
MNYDALREFADSWGLLAMVLFFVFVIAYTFRPGSKKRADEIKDIPFKDEKND